MLIPVDHAHAPHLSEPREVYERAEIGRALAAVVFSVVFM
jgi:hypothetical protein